MKPETSYWNSAHGRISLNSVHCDRRATRWRSVTPTRSRSGRCLLRSVPPRRSAARRTDEALWRRAPGARAAMIRSATFASAISPSTQAERNRNERRAASSSSSSVIELSANSSAPLSSFIEASSVRAGSPVRAAVSRPHRGSATTRATANWLRSGGNFRLSLTLRKLRKFDPTLDARQAEDRRSYRFLDRGSSASRKPSPIRLVASTVAKRKEPAKTEIHQACCSLG